MQTNLNNRLMKAAEVLIRQGEFVRCEMLRQGETTECQLVGRMENGAQLRRWFDHKMGQSAVPFSAVLLDEATAARLEMVATEQESEQVRFREFLRKQNDEFRAQQLSRKPRARRSGQAYLEGMRKRNARPEEAVIA